MSTIDDKYLGDRIKALEENITDTVAEGSTEVPTAGAVYSAIQGGAIRYVVPNAVQTNTDDIFCSTNNYSAPSPSVSQMKIYNNTFMMNESNLWIKNSAFGIDETQSVYSEVYSKFIFNFTQKSQYITRIAGIYYSTSYQGYTVLLFDGYNDSMINIMLQ